MRDDVASDLARAFYGKLFEGSTPAQALREAKIDLIDRGDPGRGVDLFDEGEAPARNLHAHPLFWAPFVFFGGSSASE